MMNQKFPDYSDPDHPYCRHGLPADDCRPEMPGHKEEEASAASPAPRHGMERAWRR